MAIKLFIDHISPDHSTAITINSLSVSYNLAVLGRLKGEKAPAFTVGKYLCILWGTTPASMTFIDVKKSPDMVSEVITAPEFTDSTRLKLKSMLEVQNSTYDSTKNYVELVLGDSPGNSINSEK